MKEAKNWTENSGAHDGEVREQVKQTIILAFNNGKFPYDYNLFILLESLIK